MIIFFLFQFFKINDLQIYKIKFQYIKLQVN
jgi:hypothetical protein